MTRLSRLPPGRAGRSWLRRRLAVAERSAILLDHKLRILRAERQRLALVTQQTSRAWQSANREVEVWLLRATLIGGERAVRLAADGRCADVEITWAQAMGVRYPSEARCLLPEPDPEALPGTNSATVMARHACRRALEAAVQHAVADAGSRAVADEESATRRRLRAIEDRWIPRLTDALAHVQLGLDEEEREEGLRLRWAAGSESRPRLVDTQRAEAIEEATT